MHLTLYTGSQFSSANTSYITVATNIKILNKKSMSKYTYLLRLTDVQFKILELSKQQFHHLDIFPMTYAIYLYNRKAEYQILCFITLNLNTQKVFLPK